MANNLEFILKLQDQFSAALKSAATVSNSATSSIKHGLDNVEAGAHGAHRGVNSLKSGIGGLLSMAAPLVSAYAAFDFLKGSFKEYQEGEKSLAQLNASLVSTQGAAGLSAKALTDQAEALQKTTLFSDDATEKMQGLLLTFTNIKGPVFTEAVPAIQDLATKMGGDLQGAALQVGKALNDPIRGLTALQRVGVTFTDSQKDLIKNLVASGHAAEAQRLILKELNKEFGGSAEAAAKADPFGVLSNQFADSKKAIGKIIADIGVTLIPVLQNMIAVFDSTVGVIIPYIKEGISFISNMFTSINNGTSQWSGYLEPIKNYYLAVWNTTKSLFGNLMNIVKGVTEWMGKSELLKDLVFVIGKAFEFVWGVIKGLGNSIEWIWNNLIKPILDKIEWVYSHIKGLFTGGKAELVITDNTKNALASVPNRSVYEDAMRADDFKRNKPLYEDAMKADDARRKISPLSFGSSPMGTKQNNEKSFAGKEKADAVNNGGQRNITINIGKQIEKLEVHVMNAQEGVQQIEDMVRESLRRVLYSLNGTTA